MTLKIIPPSLLFLVAYTQLYKSLCWSVCPSVRPFVTLLIFLPKGYLNRIKAPAHPYTTDAVVYTALFHEWYRFICFPIIVQLPDNWYVLKGVFQSMPIQIRNKLVKRLK